MRHSETNLPLQLWQWYNVDPNTHMRIRSDVTTLSTIAGACNTVEQILPSNYGNGITLTQIRTCVLGLTSQHCR